jgi:hypothetical protein
METVKQYAKGVWSAGTNFVSLVVIATADQALDLKEARGLVAALVLLAGSIGVVKLRNKPQPAKEPS